MVLKHENDWILLKDYVPYRAGELLRKGRVVEALPLLIIDWSADKPINELTCGELKVSIAKEITDWAFEQMKFIASIKPEELKGMIKGWLKGNRPAKNDETARRVYDEYYIEALLLTDHRGNWIMPQVEGGLYEQPWDFVYFLRFFRAAFVEWSAEQNKASSRPRVGRWR